MTRPTLRLTMTLAAIVAATATIVAQIQLPSMPGGRFGRSITGAFEGWFDNDDGSHAFLVGYYNRNLGEAVDIPVGPNNHIDPGGPDFGQPTHFLPGRQVGMFTVTVPKAFTEEQQLTWTITVNGETTSIPFRLHSDYVVSPFKDAAVGNTPPVLRFKEGGHEIQGPIASVAHAMPRTATVNTPLPLPLWVADDAKYTSGTNAPMRNPRPPVTAMWSLYRGPADVTFEPASGKPKVETLSGGKVGEAYSGKAMTTATFKQPGDYVLHVVGNDYSGAGGGGEVCCWTTAMLKVTVK